MEKDTDNHAVVIKGSAKAKKELQRIGKSLKGKEIFKQKVDSAKKTLSQIKSLPI